MDYDIIDKIFKNKFDESTQTPIIIGWKKEEAWKKFLKQKRKNHFLNYLKYSAAVFILGLLLIYIPELTFNKETKVCNKFSEELIENSKRQKLREIEIKLSGEKSNNDLCMNCEGFLPNKSKEKSPSIILFTN